MRAGCHSSVSGKYSRTHGGAAAGAPRRRRVPAGVVATAGQVKGVGGKGPIAVLAEAVLGLEGGLVQAVAQPRQPGLRQCQGEPLRRQARLQADQVVQGEGPAQRGVQQELAQLAFHLALALLLRSRPAARAHPFIIQRVLDVKTAIQGPLQAVGAKNVAARPGIPDQHGSPGQRLAEQLVAQGRHLPEQLALALRHRIDPPGFRPRRPHGREQGLGRLLLLLGERRLLDHLPQLPRRVEARPGARLEQLALQGEEDLVQARLDLLKGVDGLVHYQHPQRRQADRHGREAPAERQTRHERLP
jgi:hypothetical protein